MFNTVVLILYLATGSASTGMAVTSAEFNSIEACEAAGARAKARFSGWATGVYWTCSPKGAEPGAPLPR